ncbi:hypothetical protein Tco_0049644 [Tanacetum coccineum]
MCPKVILLKASTNHGVIAVMKPMYKMIKTFKIVKKFVHTPPNYVPTDDETNDESNDVDEEEYDRIDKELYGDVNVRLKDSKHKGKGKDGEKMTDVGRVHVVVENIDQVGAGNQVKDDAQAA